MYICWTRSCDFCSLQEISSLKVAKKRKGKKWTTIVGRIKWNLKLPSPHPPPNQGVKPRKYVPTVRHAWYHRAFNSQPKSSFLIHFYSIRLGSILWSAICSVPCRSSSYVRCLVREKPFLFQSQGHASGSKSIGDISHITFAFWILQIKLSAGKIIVPYPLTCIRLLYLTCTYLHLWVSPLL